MSNQTNFKKFIESLPDTKADYLLFIQEKTKVNSLSTVYKWISGETEPDDLKKEVIQNETAVFVEKLRADANNIVITKLFN